MQEVASSLSTARLELRPMGAGDLDALLDGLEDPHFPWAAGYPLEESLVAAAMVRSRTRGTREIGPWTQYQVRSRHDGLAVGDLTFLEAPASDPAGVALVTFGISPAHRGRGFATETLRGVCAWARRRGDVGGLRADTDLVDPAAPHVLRAAGLRVVQDDGSRQVYEVRWPLSRPTGDDADHPGS